MDNKISLPPDLMAKIERAQDRAFDPLFADDAVFRDRGPDDAADNHDDYLYGP